MTPEPNEPARDDGDAVDGEVSGHGIGLGEATRVWWLVALNSFGGPAGQIAVMHRFLVEDRRWFSDKRFLHSLNYCMLLLNHSLNRAAFRLGQLVGAGLGLLDDDIVRRQLTKVAEHVGLLPDVPRLYGW